jgi:hypothetical protein
MVTVRCKISMKLVVEVMSVDHCPAHAIAARSRPPSPGAWSRQRDRRPFEAASAERRRGRRR